MVRIRKSKGFHRCQQSWVGHSNRRRIHSEIVSVRIDFMIVSLQTARIHISAWRVGLTHPLAGHAEPIVRFQPSALHRPAHTRNE